MGVSIDLFDADGLPGINTRRVFRLFFWMVAPFDHVGTVDSAKFDLIPYEALERAHHELPYSFDAYEGWLERYHLRRSTPEMFNAYLDSKVQWSKEDFDEARDFIRNGAIAHGDARFSH